MLILPLCLSAGLVSATPPENARGAAQAATQTTAGKPAATNEVTVDASAIVEEKLISPLGKKEARQSRFSRAELPPQVRRVRVIEQQHATDGRGAAFVAYAVDEQSGRFRRADGAAWRRDTIVGCVYPARREVFVKRGDKYFDAGLLLGRKSDEVAAVCRAAPTITAAR